MKEEQIISLFFNKNENPQDDCFFEPPDTLITTDSLVENTHFKVEWSSPADVAIKLIEVNLSDILASGGQPTKCLLNLGLANNRTSQQWIEKFARTFRKHLQQYQTQLVGGDTFAAEKLYFNLTMFGKTKKPIFRNKGSANEKIYFSGDLGFSYLGYKILQGKEYNISKQLKKKAITKHLSPKSNFKLAQELFSNYEISACMDISDGFFQDLQKICKSSQIGANIFLEKFPTSLRNILSIEEILSSGEELELLFLSKQNLPHQIANIPIHKVGETTKIINKIDYLCNFKSFEIDCEPFSFFHF